MTEEEMLKLWALQQAFRSRVMASKRLMRAARSQLRELLSAARWSIHLINVSDDCGVKTKELQYMNGKAPFLADHSVVEAYH